MIGAGLLNGKFLLKSFEISEINKYNNKTNYILPPPFFFLCTKYKPSGRFTTESILNPFTLSTFWCILFICLMSWILFFIYKLLGEPHYILLSVWAFCYSRLSFKDNFFQAISHRNITRCERKYPMFYQIILSFPKYNLLQDSTYRFHTLDHSRIKMLKWFQIIFKSL